MRPLIDELPRHYRRSEQDTELQRVLGLLADQTQADLDFTLEQLIPSTASGWGLELWEKAYGIPVDPTQSESRRRSRVLAKIKGLGITTAEAIAGVLASFGFDSVEVVEHSAAYSFEVVLEELTQAPEDLADIQQAVNTIKPAHLFWWLTFQRAQMSGRVRAGGGSWIVRETVLPEMR